MPGNARETPRKHPGNTRETPGKHPGNTRHKRSRFRKKNFFSNTLGILNKEKVKMIKKICLGVFGFGIGGLRTKLR